jgi:hypothetical protein
MDKWQEYERRKRELNEVVYIGPDMAGWYENEIKKIVRALGL